ncbi:hypothetical protein LIER_39603 [Lithospermum erythrorhizon]|uniref:Uncharacterized protein n=1 Tax=Lithospermum erythrorhizon TaxID=34254 RepID=A0AAV3QJX9_LITER
MRWVDTEGTSDEWSISCSQMEMDKEEDATFEDSSNPDRDLNKNEPPSKTFDWIEGLNQADHVESDILSHCSTGSRVGSEDVKSGQNQIACLNLPFTPEEVKIALFQMPHFKFPGPERFPVEFYKKN